MKTVDSYVPPTREDIMDPIVDFFVEEYGLYLDEAGKLRRQKPLGADAGRVIEIADLIVAKLKAAAVPA